MVRRHVAGCGELRAIGGSGFAYEPNVSELRNAIHENDIGRFHVAMDKATLMQEFKGGREIDAQSQTLGNVDWAETEFQFRDTRPSETKIRRELHRASRQLQRLAKVGTRLLVIGLGEQ